jgi:beta-galactosidase
MFHGGTSFGWMNGANSDGRNYEPDVTSYDYDAPLDESGRPTLKYQTFRHIIAEATGTTPPPVTDSPAPIAIAPFTPAEAVSLWASLPAPTHAANPLAMEDLDQAYGYILFRAHLPDAASSGDLQLGQLHDYAQIYLDGVPVGTLDRRLSQTGLPLQVSKPGAQLDILVENTGRVNFTDVIRTERKGILGGVSLAGKPLTWDIYPLPLDDPSKLAFSKAACTGPCFYRATFNVQNLGDTFLDTTAFSKGMVWLNGHALGRVWNIGPQGALYVPGPWLKQGANEVIVFDLNGRPGRALKGRDKPLLDAVPKAGQ